MVFLLTHVFLSIHATFLLVESPEQRGQVLATGQRIRFCFSLLAGVIQTFLLNSRATNKADCQLSFDQCWSWGLSIQGYYALLFVIVAVLVIPIYWLKEIPSKHPVRSCRQFLIEMYDLVDLLICPSDDLYFLKYFIPHISVLTRVTCILIHMQLGHNAKSNDIISHHLCARHWCFNKFPVDCQCIYAILVSSPTTTQPFTFSHLINYSLTDP